MKLFVAAFAGLLAVFPLFAQQNSSASPASDGAGSAAGRDTKAEKKLHADALALVKIGGAQDAIHLNMQKTLEDGKQKMLRAEPDTDPRFADEWVKRMKARLNADEYFEVLATVYERYFTDDEILQLSQAIEARKQGKEADISPDLQQKFKQNLVNIQSDVFAETSHIGARLGGEIGQEIANEHPGWMKASKPGNPPSAR
jgi:hypothetical protein